MSTSDTTVLATNLPRFEKASAYLLDCLDDITDADLDRQTPCTEWDVRTLLFHLADVADAFIGQAASGVFELSTRPRGDDAVGVARTGITRLVETLQSAAGREAAGELAVEEAQWATATAQAGAIEWSAHGWDLATACASGRDVPSPLAISVLELATPLIGGDARPPVFDPEIDVAASATPSDRLAGFLGREPARQH